MLFIVFVLFALANADELDFYKDGFLEANMQLVNPQNLDIQCVREKDKRWIGINNMAYGNYIAMTNFNGPISTQVPGQTNNYYKTLKFTARYENDNVPDISLNVRVFPTDFNTVFNNNMIDTVKGYPVKVKNDKNSKISILLNNFNLDEKVGTILFIRDQSNSTENVNLRLENIRIDTATDETQMYENGATSIMCTLLFILLIIGMI